MTLMTQVRSLQTRVTNNLRTYLEQITTKSKTLNQACQYVVLSGGKQLRPILVYLSGQALGANIETLDAPACSVELIHSYSLAHDDLPAFDDDAFRRGQASCHKVFGEANAILAGNALQMLAVQILTESAHLQPDQKLAMTKMIAVKSGAQGMIGGQALDLALAKQVVTQPILEQLFALKTGALYCACMQFGAIAAGCNDKQVLNYMDEYARHIGLAFQIQDDLLDLENPRSDKAQLTKEPNYLDIVSPLQAKKKVTQLYQLAQKSDYTTG